MMELSNKVAVVTGASSGIGRAIAGVLGAQGAQVILAARNEKALGEVEKEIRSAGGQALAVRTDVTREADVIHLFNVVKSQFGRIDILVNNAGGNYANKPTWEVTEDEWDATLDTNVKAIFLCSRAAIRIMKGIQNFHILNITSVASFNGDTSVYGVAKVAAAYFSTVLYVEGKRNDFRVSVICPGGTDTSFWDNMQGMTDEKRSRMLKPTEVADFALQVLASDENEIRAYISSSCHPGLSIKEEKNHIKHSGFIYSIRKG